MSSSRIDSGMDIQPPTMFPHVALLAGAVASTSVDVAMFPLDTLKTRMQSRQGLWMAGGFRGIYSGLLAAAIGSAPSGALFFLSYEMGKHFFSRFGCHKFAAIAHMSAASFGEVMACLVRVPVEVTKQRSQATPDLSSFHVFKATVASEGLRGLYRGYTTTVAREIPFSLIQFPLWEFLKTASSRRTRQPVTAWQSSISGAVAGFVAAAMTTPLDVAKTRIMLAKRGCGTDEGGMLVVMKEVYHQRGMSGLFSGLVPRVIWISMGGAIFLGIYDKSRAVIEGLVMTKPQISSS